MGQRGMKQERHGGMKPRTFERQLEDLGFIRDSLASAHLGKFSRYVCGDVTVTTMSGKKAVLAGPKDKVKTGQITWDYETIMEKVKELAREKKLLPSFDEAATEKDPE